MELHIEQADDKTQTRWLKKIHNKERMLQLEQMQVGNVLL